MLPVKSSNIESVGYYAKSGDLHVRFKNGSYYIYHAVHPAIFAGLLSATSKGKHLHLHVKGKHKVTKVTNVS